MHKVRDKKMAAKRIIQAMGVILVLSTLVFFGCKKEEFDLKFNHQLHVVDNEIACADCHGAGDDGKMTNPDMDKCGECHDIDVDNPSDDCLMCHSPKSAHNEYAIEKGAPEVPASYKDLKFSHEFHDGVECTTCHAGMDKAAGLGGIEWPKMTTCQQCHNGDEAPAECESCHQKLREDVPPESHHGDWEGKHGLESRFTDSCKYCHGKKPDFCQECHQTHKPKDHIFNWKTTQHGVEATHDRRLCATCHTGGFCSDCHRSQKPISHKRGDWVAFSSEPGHAEEAVKNGRSCAVCHSTDECMECHTNIVLRQK